MLSIEPYTPALEYELISGGANNNTYRVISAAGMSGAITIPAEHEGKAVTEIGAEAFARMNITSISIPESVTAIGRDAFSWCSSLTSITIPASVTYIDEWAFANCENLSTVSFAPGSQLESIGGIAFAWCPRLTSITIPANVTLIGNQAFYGCSSLASVSFASGSQLDKIGWYAFDYCSSLTSVNIPATVTDIGGNPFAGCTRLTSIAVDDNNQNFSSAGGILYDKNKNTLLVVPAGISSVTIPPSVNNIGHNAFEDCRNITSITIPETVMGINGEAFKNCTAIANITIPSTVMSVHIWAFSGWTSSQTINIAGHDTRQSTINAGWGGYVSYDEGQTLEFVGWDADCNANIAYQAKHLVIKGISPALMTEFGNSDGFIGLFPVGTTLQQALAIAMSYAQTGNLGTAVAGSELSQAYTSADFTTAYIPLFDVTTGNPWKGSGSYMIFMGIQSNDPPFSQKAYWTGQVNFSSANTTITFNPAWEVH